MKKAERKKELRNKALAITVGVVAFGTVAALWIADPDGKFQADATTEQASEVEVINIEDSTENNSAEYSAWGYLEDGVFTGDDQQIFEFTLEPDDVVLTEDGEECDLRNYVCIEVTFNDNGTPGYIHDDYPVTDEDGHMTVTIDKAATIMSIAEKLSCDYSVNNSIFTIDANN